MTRIPRSAGSRGGHRVVIIGSGFGGLFAAKALRRSGAEVTVISKTSAHVFQPLLYQVATGILSEGEIAVATRNILRRQRDTRVLLGEVIDIDVHARTVVSIAHGTMTTSPYDTLIVAAGAQTNYFGDDALAAHTLGLKSVDDALRVRQRIFEAFEIAELQSDPAERARQLTFAVIGAGPTGVEMAGQIAELAHRVLVNDFRSIDPADARIVLVDGAARVLPSFHESLSEAAARRLNKIGVEIELRAMVADADVDGITLLGHDGTTSRLGTRTAIWTAGVAASPLASMLAAQSGAATAAGGRLVVGDDLTLPGFPDVFVIGDMAASDGVPGVAQAAIQGGRHAARVIGARMHGRTDGPAFRYRDKGMLATVSRFNAVASIGPVRLSGPLAWLLWLAVHLVYLVGFKNRIATLFHWFVSFAGRARSQRAAVDANAAAAVTGEDSARPDEAAGRTPRPPARLR